MQIRGIRSFSPHHAMNIEFFYPLTLIVGKNGSGKTTIIECLKMACTGSLPPNCRNGQAFVSDPATHCTTEVKAQVKLKFTSATGKPVICMRNFSLTQKRDKTEDKAMSYMHALQAAQASTKSAHVVLSLIHISEPTRPY